jgi:hypothetical protein
MELMHKEGQEAVISWHCPRPTMSRQLSFRRRAAEGSPDQIGQIYTWLGLFVVSFQSCKASNIVIDVSLNLQGLFKFSRFRKHTPGAFQY